MKKLLYRLLILIIAFLILSLIESEVVGDDSEVNHVMVYKAKDKIESGIQITTDLVEEVHIPEYLVSDDMVKSLTGSYAREDFEEGQFIYTHQLGSSSPLSFDEDERMITIKCSIVEGNGWLFELNEIVDVIMVTPDQEIVIEDGKVCRLFDETYQENNPEYISLIVSKSDAMVYYRWVSRSQVFIAKKY